MTTNTISNQATSLSLSTKEVSDLEFICIVDVLEAGQWVEWEVRFDLDGETFVGFLQACPNHPDKLQHDVIEDCVKY